jgi:hypothetical protein
MKMEKLLRCYVVVGAQDCRSSICGSSVKATTLNSAPAALAAARRRTHAPPTVAYGGRHPRSRRPPAPARA